MITVIGAVSDTHRNNLLNMAKFCGSIRVAYEDLGNGENYIFEKSNGDKLEIRVRRNKSDGAFINTDVTLGEKNG